MSSAFAMQQRQASASRADGLGRQVDVAPAGSSAAPPPAASLLAEVPIHSHVPQQRRLRNLNPKQKAQRERLLARQHERALRALGKPTTEDAKRFDRNVTYPQVKAGATVGGRIDEMERGLEPLRARVDQLARRAGRRERQLRAGAAQQTAIDGALAPIRNELAGARSVVKGAAHEAKVARYLHDEGAIAHPSHISHGASKIESGGEIDAIATVRGQKYVVEAKAGGVDPPASQTQKNVELALNTGGHYGMSWAIQFDAPHEHEYHTYAAKVFNALGRTSPTVLGQKRADLLAGHHDRRAQAERRALATPAAQFRGDELGQFNLGADAQTRLHDILARAGATSADIRTIRAGVQDSGSPDPGRRLAKILGNDHLKRLQAQGPSEAELRDRALSHFYRKELQGMGIPFFLLQFDSKGRARGLPGAEREPGQTRDQFRRERQRRLARKPR